jgi:hypothetical protein
MTHKRFGKKLNGRCKREVRWKVRERINIFKRLGQGYNERSGQGEGARLVGKMIKCEGRKKDKVKKRIRRGQECQV